MMNDDYEREIAKLHEEIATLYIRIDKLEKENDHLKNYVGNNLCMSDYQSVDHMRKTIDFYKKENAKLNQEVAELTKEVMQYDWDAGPMFGGSKYD